ncbi:TonB-dependent receptor [Paracoccus caeni]|uniref:TonB-dependent receptor n=1 Tax=Paracoccus caeni TaxID=657651 RepID=A0A934SIP3_9RHOB|nr:TonB-dependent receptor [Paracoccus caeni]MBK4216067.1 TonB-dependent receptor [Paracoccus caeni]
MRRSIRAVLTTSAALSLIPALPLSAQEITDQPVLLQTITLSANREETERDRSGSSVSVLDAEDLDGRAAEPISSSISRLPGVWLNQSGPLGTTGALRVRGAPTHYLPVQIDGIDVSDVAAGQPAYDIGGLIGADISRVELLRGAQSALYGSRAISGVLSLQSLRPTEDGIRHHFTLESGSYNTLLGSYGITFRQGDTDLAFSATRVRTDGFSAKDENDGNFEEDGYKATRLSFYASHSLQNGVTFGVNGFRENSTGHFDDWMGDAAGSPGDDYTDRKSFGLRGFVQFQTGAVDHELSATRYHQNRTSWSDGWGSEFVGSRTTLAYQGATDLGATGGRFVFGADTEKESASGNSAGNGDTRMNGVFAEVTSPLGERADLAVSLRRDDHSRFGHFTSGRLAGVYRLQDDLLLRGSIGNGFRAPSLYELYGPYGDPTLEREESESVEIGIEKRWGEDSYLRATAFWLKAENLIGWDDRDTPEWADDGYNQVDGTARRKGVELDGRYAFAPGYALTGAYTYTDNDVASEWAKVPVHLLNLGIEAEFSFGTKAHLNLRHVAKRPDDMKDFTTVDLLLTHPVRENAEAYLRLENIFDEQYQLVDSYGTSDRAVYVGVRASF